MLVELLLNKPFDNDFCQLGMTHHTIKYLLLLLKLFIVFYHLFIYFFARWTYPPKLAAVFYKVQPVFEFQYKFLCVSLDNEIMALSQELRRYWPLQSLPRLTNFVILSLTPFGDLYLI